MRLERENGLQAAKIAKNRNEFLRFIPSFLTAAVGGAALANIDLKNINIWEHPLPTPDPDSNNFLVIADVHGGNFDSGARQNNTQSFNTLSSVLKHLKDYPFDRMVQMGDLIRQQRNENQNIENYEKGIEVIGKVPYPVTHLLGNHDVWGISNENAVKISERHNLGSFYGVEKYKNFQIVWLDITAPLGATGALPEERVDWLRNEVIFKDTPTIIFSHYAFLPQDTDGNYYFEGDSGLTALTNGQKTWESLKGLPIHAVVSAHMHWGAYSKVGETHMITVPAFVENMISSNSGENPGVYSILEVDFPKKFVLKSYFGSICFSRIQIK
ncbi:MAG TPA: metallophosphoesterase [Patescibacteria group bacterium]|nr:metallophosphoesterase [Patescibacteria group bacterium]